MDHIFKCKTINILEETVRENLYKVGLGKKIFDMTPKAQSIKKNLDFIKMKNDLLALWKLLREWKRQSIEWQEIFSHCIFIKGWYSEYNVLSKLSRKKTSNLTEKRTKGSSRHFMQELCIREISM